MQWEELVYFADQIDKSHTKPLPWIFQTFMDAKPGEFICGPARACAFRVHLRNHV